MLKRLKEKSNDEKIKHTMNKRISFIFGAIVLIFVLIVLRLGYLQIAQGAHYSQLVKMMRILLSMNPYHEEEY